MHLYIVSRIMGEVNISKNRRYLCVKSKQKYHYKLIINILIMELDDFIQNLQNSLTKLMLVFLLLKQYSMNLKNILP